MRVQVTLDAALVGSHWTLVMLCWRERRGLRSVSFVLSIEKGVLAGSLTFPGVCLQALSALQLARAPHEVFNGRGGQQ